MRICAFGGMDGLHTHFHTLAVAASFQSCSKCTTTRLNRCIYGIGTANASVLNGRICNSCGNPTMFGACTQNTLLVMWTSTPFYPRITSHPFKWPAELTLDNSLRPAADSVGQTSQSPVYTGISILLAQPPENIPPSARLATFFPFRSNGEDLVVPADPLPRPKSHDLPDLKSISQTPPPSTPLLQIGFAWLPCLSDWQRQSLHPPQHASKQAPREMALCQQQPLVASVLDQPPACLHQPLLQAGQRLRLDSLRQRQPPPQVSQVVGDLAEP